MCTWVCLCVGICTQVKVPVETELLNPLELELWAVVSHFIMSAGN